MADSYLQRRLERQSRTIHIRRTAEQLFCADGFGSTSVDRIATEAGVTKVTLYRHFPSKRDLVLAVLQDLHQRKMAELVDDLAASSGDPAARLRGVFESVRAWLEATHCAGCTFVRATVEAVNDIPEVAQLAAQHKHARTTVLTELARDSGVRDPELLARQLAVLVEGATTLAMIDGDISHIDDAQSAATVLLNSAAHRKRRLSAGDGDQPE